MPDPEALARAADSTLHRSRADRSPPEGILTAGQRELRSALESGDPAHPDFASPKPADLADRLAAWEAIRYRQMRSAAFRAPSDAAKQDLPVAAHARILRALVTLRYLCRRSRRDGSSGIAEAICGGGGCAGIWTPA